MQTVKTYFDTNKRRGKNKKIKKMDDGKYEKKKKKKWKQTWITREQQYYNMI